MELTILMPCLNEANTLANCIKQANDFLTKYKIVGEVLIADNGSTDGSIEIAEQNGANVVKVTQKGYWNALRGGIEAAKGKYIAMGDSDESYNFMSLFPFLQEMRNGNDLVMGNRFKGGVEPGAMPFLHKYLGNPVLSFIGRLLFKIPVGDFHCGLRMFSKEAYNKMELRTTGMEFASEMVVMSSLKGLKIKEVPTTLSPDKRGRPPHLKTWSDGWRHLKFLISYSPTWSFFYPAVFFLVVGTFTLFRIFFSDVKLGSIQLGFHTMLYAACFIVISYQTLWFYDLSSRTLGKFVTNANFKTKFKFNEDYSIFSGLAIIILGVFGSIISIYQWSLSDFGDITGSNLVKLVILSVVLLMVGFQTLFNSFFMLVLKNVNPK